MNFYWSVLPKKRLKNIHKKAGLGKITFKIYPFWSEM